METAILVATWTDGLFTIRGNERTQEFANQPIRGLAPDGRDGALAIVEGHSLRERGPSGEWNPLAASGVELSCCVAMGGAIYVGTDDARVLRLSDGSGDFEPLEGFDIVAGRERWFAGSAIVNGKRLGPPLGIRSVSASADGSVLYANVHVGGIPRSIDGGKTWQPTIDIQTDVHDVRAHPEEPALVAAASAVGLCLSRDAGLTWTIEHEGLHAAHCSGVAFAGGEIFVSASADPFSPQGRVYRRPIEPGGKLTAVVSGMPEWTEGKVDTSCIAANGRLAAMADMGGNLYLSDDSGRSWSRAATGLPTPSGVLIL